MSNMSADEYLDQDIREEFAKHRSPFRTCRQLGVSLDRVMRVVGDTSAHSVKNPPRYGGRGRPELEQFIAATKNVNDPWDNSKPELRQARARYEAGTHEMCQGRDGDTIILYSIPRAVANPLPEYFRSGAD
jgi:hypothetical protein